MTALPANVAASVPAIVRFDNLTLGYNRHPAVHHLKGEIAAGSLIAVVGPNGAGKSTLLKGITGELRPLQGRVDLCGVKRAQIAYLTQQSTLDASFPITINDFVALGLWSQFGAFRGYTRAAGQRNGGSAYWPDPRRHARQDRRATPDARRYSWSPALGWRAGAYVGCAAGRLFRPVGPAERRNQPEQHVPC